MMDAVSNSDTDRRWRELQDYARGCVRQVQLSNRERERETGTGKKSNPLLTLSHQRRTGRPPRFQSYDVLQTRAVVLLQEGLNLALLRRAERGLV